MKTVEEKIKEIRTHLRLAMNGVTSTSMREKGIVYKLNFGVPYLEIKQIAVQYDKDAALAAALWKEDIREFKILASMLQPADCFTLMEAREWVAGIRYLEIAEHCSKNLFGRLSFANELALELIYNVDDAYARTVAFLIWTELFRAGKDLDESVRTAFLVESMHAIDGAGGNISSKERGAAINAMKFFGRRSERDALQILERFDVIPDLESRTDLQEIYNELKFEFDYYR